MIVPLLAQAEPASEGVDVGGIFLGVLIGLLAWLGARIIAGRGGPKRGA